MFLGPSLSHQEARRLVDADFRPPIKRGDLSTVQANVIAIIDGVLLSDAAVGHREILQCLQSSTVIGGGSMGALRAAELNSLGMKGIGRIYQEYASGRIDGDDEVVLMYDPFTLKALSEPLITLRLNVERAVEERIIRESQAHAIIDQLKSTFYPRRSYRKLLAIGENILTLEELRNLENFFQREYIDFKRDDAILVLKELAKLTER